MLSTFRVLISSLLATVFTPACADTNLLPNGDFSNAMQITGWTLHIDINAGTLSWNSDDAGADPGSGSMQLDTDSIGEPTMATSDCFAVPDGGAYRVSGQTKVVAGGGSFDFQFGCSFTTDGNCSGTGLSGTGPTLSYSSSWSTLQSASGTVPNGAKSAKCYIYLQNVYNAAIASVRFDNLLFTADYIFHNAFE